MTSTDSVATHECRNIPIEQKFTYKWIIRNFSCENVTSRESLPTIKFEFKFRPDIKFVGELSLHGNSCRERLCCFTLKSPTHHIWKASIKLIVVDYDIRYISLDNTSNTERVSLHRYSVGCELGKDNPTIMCEIKYMDYIKERSQTYGFVKLFNSKKYWDVTLIVAGLEVHAHKCILASRSKVFAAMFDSEMEEAKTNKVTISDINFEVLQEMLWYIYTNDVLNLNKMASELLAVSDKYDLKHLKSMCENELANIVSMETAAETLILADMYNAKELKEQTIAFIKSNNESVQYSDGWRILVQDHYHLLADIYLMSKN